MAAHAVLFDIALAMLFIPGHRWAVCCRPHALPWCRVGNSCETTVRYFAHAAGLDWCRRSAQIDPSSLPHPGSPWSPSRANPARLHATSDRCCLPPPRGTRRRRSSPREPAYPWHVRRVERGRPSATGSVPSAVNAPRATAVAAIPRPSRPRPSVGMPIWKSCSSCCGRFPRKMPSNFWHVFEPGEKYAISSKASNMETCLYYSPPPLQPEVKTAMTPSPVQKIPYLESRVRMPSQVHKDSN